MSGPSFMPPPPQPPMPTPATQKTPAPKITSTPKPAPVVPAPAPAPATPPVTEKKAPVTAEGIRIDPTLLPPNIYGDIWKKVLAYFMSIRRIDIFTCMKKGNLIYCSKQRAIVSSPQQWLVAAGNNKAYQKIAAEAFQKVVGAPVMLHAVLAGGEEEADALTLLKTSLAGLSGNPAPAEEVPPISTPAAPKEAGYHKVEETEARDRNAPSFKEALKILPDCDIYEKD